MAAWNNIQLKNFLPSLHIVLRLLAASKEIRTLKPGVISSKLPSQLIKLEDAFDLSFDL
jgi:hypothetical protein